MVSDHDYLAWRAGAAEVDITPPGSPYLCGYPYVNRDAEGVHDALWASALCLDDGRKQALFLACDVLNLPRGLANRARVRIEQKTGIPATHVMLTATHTHSGPLTVHMVTNEADPKAPRPDNGYLKQLEARIVEAATLARQRLRPAHLAFAAADSSSLGSNRHDPNGPRIARLPVLVAHTTDTAKPIAVMAVCAMHPTVLHEDWRHISGDFPGLARLWLQENVIGPGCPFIYHMGAGGNQSPRHVVRNNTIREARRLGKILGQEVRGALKRAEPLEQTRLHCSHTSVRFPLRRFDSVETARQRADQFEARWHELRNRDAAPARIRTAEVDWFGARKALALTRAATDGRLQQAAETRLPAIVQLIGVGEQTFVGWPGEVFAEFAIDVMRDHPGASLITLANGELHGYLVTREAVDSHTYEAAHAIFESPTSGEQLVEATKALLAEMPQGAA